jgi:8-oxo-dGTP pyrophosphatase MutT (NUDIX family)
MASNQIPTYYFCLIIVRLGRRFLIVQQNKNNQWYLPGGRIAQGEELALSAAKQCLEETGIPVILDGIVRIQHTLRDDGKARVRVIYTAYPDSDLAPKSNADEHSVRAAWVTLDELEQMPLRGREVVDLFRYVAYGGVTYPLSVLGSEKLRIK